ncbi:MAG: MATE family efflux transporter [Bacteroidaceae bacterium]|nr:MATE family efflux transporter [Bacteroidaceae bacterium]
MQHRARILSIIQLAYPIVIAQIGSIMQGWADTIMVGQYGTPELSAAGFVNNVFNLCIYFLLGISYATTPIVGNYYSQGRYARVLRTLRDSNWVNLLASLVVVLLLSILYLNIHRLGQPVELLPLMRPYFLALLASLPFMSLFNSMKQFSDALGDTKTPMWTMIGSNILNLILNYLLIFTFDLGLFGAGLATLIARALMPLAQCIALRRGHLLRSPNFQQAEQAHSQFTCSRQGMLALLKLGIPISTQLCLEASSFNVVAIFMGWIGAAALAAHQIMSTVSTLAFMVYYGIGAAAAIRIAYFRGQEEWDEVRKTASTALGMSFVSGMALVAIICLASPHIAPVFTSSHEVILLFLSFLPCFVCYQIGDCLQVIYANALRAVENVRAMMLYAFIAYCLVSVPLAYLFAFPLGMGAVGIWWSFPFGLTTAGLSYYFQFRRHLRRVETSS